MKLYGLILITGLVSALCIPAQAQMTGTRLGKNANSDDAPAVLALMAECVGKRSPAYAKRIMTSMPGSNLERQEIFSNSGDLGMCMDDTKHRLVLGDNIELRMSARQFRVQLALVMARRSLQGKDFASLADKAKWSPDIYSSDTVGAASSSAAQLALYEFGDCVLAARPGEAARLIREGHEKSEGEAAMARLVPILGACLTEGVRLELTPELLMAALAEPIYHRATASDQPAGSPREGG